jgi:hypothetical protein
MRTYKYFQYNDLNIKNFWKFSFKRNLSILEETVFFGPIALNFLQEDNELQFVK